MEKEKLIERVNIFVNNMNSSLTEREQLIDSLDVLLDRLADFQVSVSEKEAIECRRLLSLLEVITYGFKNNQATDGDSLISFNQQCLLPEKEKWKSVENRY